MAKIVSKQDRLGARTPTDLEYKYSFNKNISATVNAATEAQRVVRESSAAVSNVSISVDRLAKEVSELFTKNHEMTGVLSCTTSAYIPPGDKEIETITKHLSGTETIPSTSIPLYDFNNNGVIDSEDATLAKSFKNDLSAFKAWRGAVVTTVTIALNLSDAERIIKYTGVNLWGRSVEGYIGINFTEERIANLESRLAILETKLGGE